MGVNCHLERKPWKASLKSVLSQSGTELTSLKHFSLSYFHVIQHRPTHWAPNRLVNMVRPGSLVIKLPFNGSLASSSRASATASTTVAPNQVPPVKITTHFTQTQLALAFAIQKAKPESLSTYGRSAIFLVTFLINFSPEYCQQLRQSIKTGQPISGNALRFIDTCEFWKDQYTKIHLEKKGLEEKVHRLEERQRQLLEGHSQHNVLSAVNTIGQVFDTTQIDVGLGVGASRKRPAPIVEEWLSSAGIGEIAVELDEGHFLRMNSYGK